jgi:ABC-type multidrug transport system fused ATPase/permease subunit
MRDIIRVLRFVGPQLKPYWPRFLMGILLGVLFGALNGGFMVALKILIERLTEPQTAASTLLAMKAPAWAAGVPGFMQNLINTWLPLSGQPVTWKQAAGCILLLPGLTAIRGVAGYLSGYCMSWVSERVVNGLRNELMVKFSSLSLDYFNRASMGDMTTRINSDTLALRKSLGLGFDDLIKQPMTVVSILVVGFFLEWRLTVFCMIFLPLSAAPMIILTRKARKAAQKVVDMGVFQSSHLLEVLGNIRVVQAFGLERQQEEEFRGYSKQLVQHGMRGVRARELVNPLVEVIAVTGIGVILFYIFYANLRVQDLLAFLSGLALLPNAIKKIASTTFALQLTSVSIDRLQAVLDEQPTVKEKPNARPVPGFSGEIRIENVRFTYGDMLVLDGVDLVIPKNRKLGIAGESGSGKSTLINLLFRFYDVTGGRILIDGADLRDVRLAELRSQMALVSQEVVLFNRTVAENIACGKIGATQVEIEMAARAAHAHDFILELPEGYQTKVGERGVRLSGGQRQRIAIARAFVRNAPILVLDEATAALDSQSEAEVQKAIDGLSENRTVISVAHRLSTLATCDQIIVLTRGKIMERGSYQELLGKGSAFAAMAARQGIFAKKSETEAAEKR